MPDAEGVVEEGGLRAATLAAIIDAAAGFPNFLRLLDVTNKWHSLSGEFRFYLMEKCGLAVGRRCVKFWMKDFAALNTNNWTNIPRIDYLNGSSTGHGTRPYRGSTGAFRIFRRF